MSILSASMAGPVVVRLRGNPGDMGYEHGALLRPMVDAVFDRYMAAMAASTRVDAARTVELAQAWMAGLPAHVREEMAGMAAGMGRSVEEVAAFLYADIARGGAACSGMVAPGRGGMWVARNCDWRRGTLMRGVSVVVHEVPGRIPCMGMGINGDIDVDTGANAERLWMHVHTMHATDAPGGRRACFSWLFWVREALETCASLADVERLLDATDRDRGVILFVVDGKTNDAAVYECACTSWARIDPAADGTLTATNHCQRLHPTDVERLARARATSTTGRLHRVRELMGRGALERGAPEGMIRVLADPRVEMGREAPLTTIYAAACCPASGELWFAGGPGEVDVPAASRATWRRVKWPW
ncbi:MAG: C45 family peptidase [Planctomycetota bacterium]|nr:C45 family peptidase [Planctomycetota bacterium]